MQKYKLCLTILYNSICNKYRNNRRVSEPTTCKVKGPSMNFLFIPTTHSVEGYYNLVPTQNACNRQKEAWQTLQTI